MLVNGSYMCNSEFLCSELCEILFSGRFYNWCYVRVDNWLEVILCIEVVFLIWCMIIG